MSASEWSLTARWVFPVDAPPLERGIVTILGDWVLAVEPNGSRAADYDLGNVAILPGLVNSHTHLDLSGLRGKCPPTPDFTEWLRGVIRHRRSQTPEGTQADIRKGVAEALQYGTTLLGDIAAEGTSWEVLVDAPLRSVVFYEMLGLSHERVKEVLLASEAWVGSHGPTENCRPAVSPHAPYSTNHNLFFEAAKLAETRKLCLATHLAETRAELELLALRSGPFVDFLKELNVGYPQGIGRQLEYYFWYRGWHPRRLLLTHCNYLPTGIWMSIPHEATIVYCPRTHAAFGHPPHPFREFLARGVRVALGTDSLASNPDLDVLAEARFIHARHPDVPGDVLVRMATLSGAEALGWADETGSLTPGKSADLIVLPLPNADARDPHNLILESALPLRAVMFRGQWTHGRFP
jgi:cytosine/adenosine deaminase-related metal-dependent hydrolase